MKRGFFIAVLACQLALGQFALSGYAQQASKEQQSTPPPEPQEPARPSAEDVVKITTNLVQVDAVITDKNGKLVRDLRPEEVRIFEDGHPQKITHFSFVTSESAVDSAPAPVQAVDKSAPPAPPVKLRPEDVRRTIALVVDDLGLSFESTYYVRRALKKFIDQQMQPGDLVAIIRTSGGIGALQQFTADKRQLSAAIDRVKWYPSGRSGVGVFAPIDDTIGRSEALQDANEEVNQFREDVFAVGTLGAVGYVVKGMRELPGRKSILLISDGFRIHSLNDPTRNYRTLAALRYLIDQANRATVVIYTMNAAGLQTIGLTAADSTPNLTSDQVERQLSDRRTAAFESQEGLSYLARETGGIAIRNTNDLSGGIRRVLEDQKSYYLIGYRPDESTFDSAGRRTFHKLSLKVERPGKFNVRMRNGFYGVSDDDQNTVAATPRQLIIRAITSPFGASGVRLRLTSLFANDAKAGSYMRSFLHVNANDLTFKDLPDGSHQADFDVVAITFGDNGNVVDQVGRSYTMRVSGDNYSRIRQGGFVYFLTVPIKKAGAYQLRTALLDHGSDHVGSASQFIEVPDMKKNRLVISGVLLTANDPATGKPVPAESGGDASQQPGNQSKDPGAWANLANSAATRQFKPGQIVQYSFVIYNSRLDKATGQPQLSTQLRMLRDRQPVFTGKDTLLNTTTQPDLKRITIQGAIRLGSEMVPGEYVLQVSATDPLADEKYRGATQWLEFEIVK